MTNSTFKKTEDASSGKSQIIIATAIWLLLLLLTTIAIFLDQLTHFFALSGSAVIIAALTITVIKSQLVSDFYMELRHAPNGWRLLMSAYVLLIPLICGLIYLSA